MERIGKIQGGIAIIKAGGMSSVESNECRDRIEDALFAVRASLEDGYVAGGGFALLRAASLLDSSSTENEFERMGIEVVKKACEAPARQIIINKYGSAGKAARLVHQFLEHTKLNPDDKFYGYDSNLG